MKTAVLFLITLVAVGCSKPSDSTDTKQGATPSLRLSVLKTGTILADGKETTLPELEQTLEELKKMGGTVWYYREAGQEEPPPQAVEVIKLVVGQSLPVMMSSEPDFSDYIGEDGRSHPRNK